MIIEQRPTNFSQSPQIVSSMAKNRRSVSPAEPAYRLAKVLVGQEKWEPAITAYQQALTIAPTWVEVQRELGDLLLKLEQWEEAVKVYEIAITLQSDVAQVHHNLGDALLKLQRWDEAAQAYQKAIELNPDFSWSYNNLGDALRELERWDEAAQAYQTAIKLKGDFALSHHHLGDVLVKKEKWPEAIAAYQKAIELDPNFVWSHYNLGDAFRELEQWDGAVQAYQKAMELNKDFVGSCYNLGDALSKLKQGKPGISQYPQAIQLESSLPAVHEKLATAWHHQVKLASQEFVNFYRQSAQENPDNLQNYYQILEIIPDDYWANLRLAQAFDRKGELDQAIIFCKNAIASQPNEVTGYIYLADLLVKYNKIQQAIENYQKALKLEPKHLEIYDKLAKVLIGIQELEQAELIYKKALEIQPNADQILERLVEINPIKNKIEKTQKQNNQLALQQAQEYRQLGDQDLKNKNYDEAINHYHKALALKPDFWQVHHSLGDALKKQEKWDQAVASYQQALAINPNFFWSAYNLANTFAEQHKIEQAIIAYHQAADLEPYRFETYHKLADLLKRQGKTEEAKQYNVLANNLKSHFIPTVLDLAIALEKQDKTDAAVACYRRAIEVKPDEWEIYNRLSHLLQIQGNLEEEIKLYQKALEINPNLVEFSEKLEKKLQNYHQPKKIKIEGIPDNFILPPIIGENNDYTFIEEKVKQFVDSGKPYTLPVSIIIPTYNRKAILAKTLAALTHQTYPKNLIEIIVADDGSTDGVEEVILKYENYLELIHVRQQDRGYRLCAVRNLGIRTAKYEQIIILDCDLIPEPKFVEELMKYLHVTDQAVLMAHRRFVNTDDITDDQILENINVALQLNNVISENVMFKSHQKNQATFDWRFELYEKTDNLKKEKYPFRAFASGHVAYSKQVIRDAGAYDEDFQHWGCEDIEFGYRVYNAGYYFIPVLTAIDLHQEPPDGSNETDRISGKQITQKLLEQKCPAGWYRKYKPGKMYEVPKVSVYIPAYNAEKFIKQTVDSVLNQTYTDLEVCICDDGSIDGTLKVLEENFLDNPRVRWVSQPHGGIGKASNTAVKMCRGMYIGQLDSDDILKPDAVEIMVKYLDQHDVGCVYSCCERIDQDGNYIKDEYNWLEFSREKMMITMIVHHFRMFRKKDWMRTDGFAEDLVNAVDYDLYMKLSEVCSFHHLNQVTYCRRIHGKNTSLLYEKEQDSNTIVVINRSLKRLGLDQAWGVRQSHPLNPRKLEIFKKSN